MQPTMMQKMKEWSGVVALIAIFLTWLVPSPTANVGGGTRFPNGLSTDSTAPSSGQVRTATLTTTGAATLASATITGSLTQSTSNSATTTAALGCIQTTATSTATPIRFVIGSGANATTTYQGTNGVGSVVWQYGSCPI